MFVVGANSPSGYFLNRSLRFRASASASLSRTPATTTNRQVWTWSAWVKLGTLTDMAFLQSYSGTPATQEGYIRYTSNQFGFSDSLVGVSTQISVQSTAVLRDPSAWYHLMVVANTPSATASERIQLYINGSRVTALSATTYPSQNFDTGINRNVATRIGTRSGTSEFFDGYMADVYLIDGQALTPASFGSTNALTGVWQPAPYTGTYGTNGFYLNFEDTSSVAALGDDTSGNGNDWTVNNVSLTAGVTFDSMTDVPTLTSATVANYAVLNPTDLNALNSNIAVTLSSANLQATATNGANRALGTIGVTTGKWYAEISITSITGGVGQAGVCVSYVGGVGNGAGGGAGVVAYLATGNSRKDSGSAIPYGSSYTTNDVIGVALDMDASQVTFYKNNVSQGAISLTTGQPYTIGFNWNTSAGQTVAIWSNFGQLPFSYAPPTGFLALNTFNLPTSTIVKGNTVMDATLYTGTGASLAVTNAAGFQPDLVWVKGRSGATDHALYDSVRGVQNQIESNTTTAETAEATGLTAFGSGGFTVGALAQMNTSAATYVGWQWKAGGAAASNTNGTITSQVSVNATAGFSVATYTGNATAGATVGHGLGVAPAFIIVKARSAVTSWSVYHQSLGASQYILLNTTAAAVSSTQEWGGIAPTSSVITIGNASSNNNQAATNVLYAFAQIEGYSAFGSYTGNGSADGPFVYLGFRPKFMLIKGSSFVSNWFIQDSARNGYNVNNGVALRPNLSNAEDGATTYNIDILSNGFKLRSSAGDSNSSSATFAYAAFAENPFRNSLAR